MTWRMALAWGIGFLFTGQTLAADFDLRVTLVPRATYFINTLYDAIKARQQLDEIASITIANNTSTDREVKLRIQIYSQALGEKEILDITTYPAEGGFPITVKANQTKVITNRDIDINRVENMVLLRVSPSEIQSRVQSAYGADLLTKYAGLMPGDTFTYKVYLFETTTRDTIGSELASTSESIFQPLEFGNIDLISPANQSALRLDNPYPTFIWSPLRVRSGLSINYRVRVWQIGKGENYGSPESIPGNPILNSVVINRTTFDYPTSAESLKADTDYVWVVTATDDLGLPIGKTGSSPVWKFTMAPITPAELSEPQSEITGVPFTFRWRDVLGATKYQLYVDKDPSFSRALIIDGVEQTQLAMDQEAFFEPGKIFYWYVQAIGSDGKNWGDKSAIGKFSYNQNIRLIWPIETRLIVTPPDFSWTGIGGAQEFQLEIDTKSGFDNPTRLLTRETRLSVGSDLFSFEPETRYYWRVQGKGPSGENWGNISPSTYFDTPSLSVPRLTSPLDQTLIGDLTEFKFNKVDWATQYRIQISERQGSWDGGFTIESDQGVPKLKLGTQYFWRVIPIAANGKTYDKFSDVGTFKTKDAPAPKTTAGPANQVVQEGAIEFGWGEVESAASYFLMIAQNPDFSNAKLWKTNGTRITVNDSTFLKPGIQFFWAVQALNEAGVAIGPRSAYASFKVAGATAEARTITDLVSPLDETLQTMKVAFKWLSLPLAKGYVLSIGENADMSGALEFKVPSHSATSDEIGFKFKMDKTYYWNVRMVDQTGVVGDPSKQTGKIIVPLFQAKLVAPVDTEESTNALDLSWQGIPDATRYRVLLSTDPKLTGAKASLTSDFVLPAKDLIFGQTYYWQVIPLGLTGQPFGKESVVGKFTIKPKATIAAATFEEASSADTESFMGYLNGYLKEQTKKSMLDDWEFKKITMDGATKINKLTLKAIQEGKIKINAVKGF